MKSLLVPLLLINVRQTDMDRPTSCSSLIRYGVKHLKFVLLQARRAAAAEARKQDSEAAEDTSESSTNPDDDANMYEDLFTAVMMATDQDNRPLHTVFQLLPSKKVRGGKHKFIVVGTVS
jgi:hypothetical protein